MQKLKVRTTALGALFLRGAVSSPQGPVAVKRAAAKLRDKIESQAQAVWDAQGMALRENGGFKINDGAPDAEVVLSFECTQVGPLRQLFQAKAWAALPPALEATLFRLDDDLEDWSKRATNLAMVAALPEEERKQAMADAEAAEGEEPA